MAGIYIHIPFCRKKCFYCDFYKTTAVSQKPLFLRVLRDEIRIQQNYLAGETVETVYFGGGTPSVLSQPELKGILDLLYFHFSISNTAEITVEANPDDLSLTYLHELRESGVNRLSIGIQSFSEEALKRMNRRHTVEQALQSVRDAWQSGFRDISIDLIYGLPGLTLEQWQQNLNMALELPANHLSAYHLTYHEGTRFHQWLKNGQLAELPEEESLEQFDRLVRMTGEAGFEQYEISNFALNGAYSRHNTSYWNGSKYLGLGPSAHSYDGISRQWNVSDIYRYSRAIQNGSLNFEREVLTEKDRLNDYLITRLRTKWGISLRDISRDFGETAARQTEISAHSYLQSGLLQQHGDVITLSRNGIMVSDEIMLALVV